ncbi:MAG: dihydroorotate dehydrogenase-like protein [Bacteroidetes bacterium]|nr:dihydroorotate dehydrogenase-like protein [Bacteroidota bacterium]
MNLKTKYLGLELKNPIIVGASNLVTDPDILRNLEDAGAGAIIYKSLFEEQIQLENLEKFQIAEEYGTRHAEMSSTLANMGDAGPEEFLFYLRKAKEAVGIPLIASLNAVFEESWVEYAQKIEQTGVDAIELNFYSTPYEFDVLGKAIVSEQIDMLEVVTKNVKIPVSVKLSPFYTNPLYVINEMDKIGVQGFVLFNRLFQPDIDIETETMKFSYNLSNVEDNRLALRYAGLLHNRIKADICSNTGILSGSDVIKMILAGASSVQIVSVIYQKGPKQINKMLKEIMGWMEHKGYKTLDDFRGKLSKNKIDDIFAYKRSQYVDIMMKSDEIFKKHPLP